MDGIETGSARASGPGAHLTRKWEHVAGCIWWEIRFDNEDSEYMIQLEADEFDSIVPSLKSIDFRNRVHQRLPLNQTLNGRRGEAGISLPRSNDVPQFVKENIDDWRIYLFFNAGHTSPLKRTCDLNDNRFLRTDGSNIAACMFLLRERHEKSFYWIKESVQRIASFLDDFILQPMALNEDKIRLEW